MRLRLGRLCLLAGLALPFPLAAIGQSLGGDKGQDKPKGQPARTDLYGDPLPQGAVARLGTVRLRHATAISALAVSPDGAVLASAGYGTVSLWDPATGRKRRRLVEFAHDVALAFSPDGKTLAVSSLGWGVQLWKVATGTLQGQIDRFPGRVQSVAFSRDGATLLVTAGPDAVLLWDVARGKPRFRYYAPQSYACAALSPDGKKLALGYTAQSPTRGVRLRDMATEEDAVALVTRGVPKRLLYTPGGKGLVVDEADSGLGFWDTATGKKLHTFRVPERTRVFSLALTPDGKTLAAALEYQLPGAAGAFQRACYFWDVRTGQRTRRLEWEGAGYTQLAFLPDGKALVLGGYDGTLLVWDLTTGRERRPYTGHRGGVSAVAFSPDGNTVASAGQDRTVRLWDVATGRQRLVLKDHRAEVSAIAFSLDGKTLASAGSWDNTLRLWDPLTGKERCPPRDCGSKILAVAYTPDGKAFATGTAATKVQFRDTATGNTLRVLTGMPTGFLTFAPGGGILAVPGDRASDGSLTVRLVDPDNGEERRALTGHTAPAYAASFSPDGKLLVSSGGHGALWEVATGQELCRFQFATGPVAFAPEGNLVALGSQDGAVRVCAVTTGKVLKEFRGAARGVFTSTLAFSPDGRLLASGSQDSTVLLWDVTGLSAAARPAATALTEKELQARWTDLAAPEAARAFRALWALVASGKEAVPFLRERLRQVHFPSAAHIDQLIADLDSPRFASRQRAAAELVKLGAWAEAPLRRARGKLSLEAARRAAAVSKLLADPSRFPEPLRVGRALQALEQIGSAEARVVLREVAERTGALSSGQEARAALDRLARRFGKT